MFEMSFEGKWKRSTSENEEAVLKYIGLLPESIKILMKSEVEMEIKKEGETFYETFTQLGQQRKNSLTPGKPAKYLTFDGNYVECTPEFGKDWVKIVYVHQGIKYFGKRQLTKKNVLVDDLVLDDGKCIAKYTYKRV